MAREGRYVVFQFLIEGDLMKRRKLKARLFSLEISVGVLFLLLIMSNYRDTVRTSKIELTSNGKPVAFLTTNDSGDPELKLYGTNGNILVIRPDGISGLDDMMKHTFDLQSGGPRRNKESGPRLSFSDSTGLSRASMYLYDGDPYFTFNYNRPKDHGLAYETKMMMYGTSDTAYIQLYDKDRKVIWSAPGSTTD